MGRRFLLERHARQRPRRIPPTPTRRPARHIRNHARVPAQRRIKTTDTIRKLDPSRPKILLGGSAITHAGLDAHELGADAIVNDVAQAAQIARRLVGRTIAKPSLDQQLAAIGQNIRTARNHRKLTQQQLADASDLDRTYISLVEHGKQNLTIAAILKIAQALNIPITDLINT